MKQKKKSKGDYKQIELTHRKCDYKQRSSYPRELITRIASRHNHSGLGIPVSTLGAEALRSIFPDKSSFSQLRVGPTYLGRSKGLCAQGNRSREHYQTVRTGLIFCGYSAIPDDNFSSSCLYLQVMVQFSKQLLRFRILLMKQNFQTRHTASLFPSKTKMLSL